VNYLPYVGYCFFGGTSATEMANYTASWGLISHLPLPGGPTKRRFHPSLPIVPKEPIVRKYHVIKEKENASIWLYKPCICL